MRSVGQTLPLLALLSLSQAVCADTVDSGSAAANPVPLAPTTVAPAPNAPPGTLAAPTGPGGVTEDPLEEVVVTAAEPRFVAPTRRDRIGRIWAPVYLDGHGPFRLVLDSGASRSGVTLAVAQALGLPLDQTPPVLLRGVTGTAQVPTVRIGRFEVGDLLIQSPIVMPIITDALGGAQGILGTGDLHDRRIRIEFKNDLITIARSHNERAPDGFVTVPFKLLHGQLLAVDARIGRVRTTAIIDTGGQISVANLALRDALWKQRDQMKGHEGSIEGVTTDIQYGDTAAAPPINIGPIIINDGGVTFSNLQIFQHWGLTQEPTIFIGMDALGLFDTLIIDYKRHELQIRMPQQPGGTTRTAFTN